MNYDRLFWQQRELEKTLAELRRLPLRELLPSSLLTQMHELELLKARFSLPPSYLSVSDEIQKSLAASLQADETFREIARLQLEVPRVFNTIEGTINRIGADLARSTNDAAFAIQAMTESLIPPEALLRIGQIEPSLVNVALRPHFAFEEFVSARLAAADAASEVFRANTLEVISSASHLLSQMARGPELASLLLPPNVEILPLPDVNVFTIIETNLGGVDLGTEEADTGVAEAPPGKVVELGVRIIDLAYNLNVEAEREGREMVFKPTNRSMRAFYVVTSHVAYDEVSFGEVVDHLYFLLYEGSGEAKRLTELLPENRLEALWRLKNLRLGLRHDVDHGSESEYRKKAEKIGAAYSALVGRSVPRSSAEWSQAQIELYRELVEMLDALWGS